MNDGVTKDEPIIINRNADDSVVLLRICFAFVVHVQ